MRVENCVYFVHCCIPKANKNAWHMFDPQYKLVRWVNIWMITLHWSGDWIPEYFSAHKNLKTLAMYSYFALLNYKYNQIYKPLAEVLLKGKIKTQNKPTHMLLQINYLHVLCQQSPFLDPAFIWMYNSQWHAFYKAEPNAMFYKIPVSARKDPHLINLSFQA